MRQSLNDLHDAVKCVVGAPRPIIPLNARIG